jgi:transposase
MSHKLDSIVVIGIDIGKNSFHIVGQDRRGALVLRQKWSRGQMEARLANLPPCLIGMEACTGAHHLSRKLQALGHDARLMPAKYVRPLSRCGSDRRSSAAPDDEIFATKTADQLDLQALHRVRAIVNEQARPSCRSSNSHGSEYPDQCVDPRVTTTSVGSGS